MEYQTIRNKVKKHKPSILGNESYAFYSVLLPLIQKEDGLHVLFEVRSENLRRQPGEISFPGGKFDQTDLTEKDTAIRETIEELGIKKTNIVDVYPLDYLVSPFNMVVYPFAGLIPQPNLIQPNPKEVGETFSVPLSFFIETQPEIHYVNFKIEPEDGFPFELIPNGKDYNWRTRKIEEYFYMYKGRVIWGLTARILSHFIELINGKGE